MGSWKTGPKEDGVRAQGPAGRQKQPFPGVISGGGVGAQENPRRMRRQDYTPKNANARRYGGTSI